MGLFFNRRNENKVNWEDTKEGKAFAEKVKLDAERRAREKIEWEMNVPQEKKEQVKLFKIIITICTVIFAAFLFAGFMHKKELIVLSIEGAIALMSFILYKIKPKFVKYPNCFMMPVITFFFMLLFSVYLYFTFGKPIRDAEKEKQRIEAENNQNGLNEFSNSEYSSFLKENGLQTDDEIEEAYYKNLKEKEESDE